MGVDSDILAGELARIGDDYWRLKERKELERPLRGQAYDAEQRVAFFT